MDQILFLMVLVGLCIAAPQFNNKQDDILKYSNSVDQESYNFRYETARGVYRKEEGHFRDGVWVVTGAVSTLDPSGVTHIVYYVADDKGYRTKHVTKSANGTTDEDGEAWLAENGGEDGEPIDRIPVKNKTLLSLLGG